MNLILDCNTKDLPRSLGNTAFILGRLIAPLLATYVFVAIQCFFVFCFFLFFDRLIPLVVYIARDRRPWSWILWRWWLTWFVLSTRFQLTIDFSQFHIGDQTSVWLFPNDNRISYREELIVVYLESSIIRTWLCNKDVNGDCCVERMTTTIKNI